MSVQRPHSPQHLARYLDRVRGSYPYGIPETAIATPTIDEDSVPRPPLVSFIVMTSSEVFPAEYDALMDSIVNRGLKIETSQTARRIVRTDSELQAALDECAAHNGVVIVLGAEPTDGRLEPRAGAYVLYSHSLTSIASEPSVKRAFWGHLQSVLGRIA